MNHIIELHHHMRPDESDRLIKRQELMFDGRLLDDDEYLVYGRLHAYRAGRPSLSLDELLKWLWTWRCWRDHRGDYLTVARLMREKGWPGVKATQVRYRIRKMAEQGCFHNVTKMPRIR